MMYGKNECMHIYDQNNCNTVTFTLLDESDPKLNTVIIQDLHQDTAMKWGSRAEIKVLIIACYLRSIYPYSIKPTLVNANGNKIGSEHSITSQYLMMYGINEFMHIYDENNCNTVTFTLLKTDPKQDTVIIQNLHQDTAMKRGSRSEIKVLIITCYLRSIYPNSIKPVLVNGNSNKIGSEHSITLQYPLVYGINECMHIYYQKNVIL